MRYWKEMLTELIWFWQSFVSIELLSGHMLHSISQQPIVSASQGPTSEAEPEPNTTKLFLYLPPVPTTTRNGSLLKSPAVQSTPVHSVIPSPVQVPSKPATSILTSPNTQVIAAPLSHKGMVSLLKSPAVQSISVPVQPRAHATVFSTPVQSVIRTPVQVHSKPATSILTSPNTQVMATPLSQKGMVSLLKSPAVQ